MQQTLNERIEKLEREVANLTSKLNDISNNVEEKKTIPYTRSGGIKDQSQQRPTDVSTGLGQTFAGSIIWNDSELVFPPYGRKPNNPTKGYNRHSHSRYSGGALDINTLEIVEYDVDWEADLTHHKDCQSLWNTLPKIKRVINSRRQSVEKLGKLDLVFNADTSKWGAVAYEIDVKRCYLVERDDKGNIALDEDGNEKKALLFSSNPNKTCIVWDKMSKTWRFYAVYAETPETE